MDRFWELLCLVGVWGWISCTALFIMKGFGSRGSFAARAALPWGVAMALCFALWLVGMVRA